LKTHFDFLESQMATSPNQGQYLCGPKLTGADIVMSFPLEAAKGRAEFTKETHPKLWAYVDRLKAHDGYKRAAERIIQMEGSFGPNL
jgi:glutathione S-transferase